MRRIFYKKVSRLGPSGPLSVNWGPGDVELDLRYHATATVWSRGGGCGAFPGAPQVLGLAEQIDHTMRFKLDRPATALAMFDMPACAEIRSVRVNGVEQLAAPLLTAVFRDRQYFVEEPRAWWGWAPKLWRWLRGEDDDC